MKWGVWAVRTSHLAADPAQNLPTLEANCILSNLAYRAGSSCIPTVGRKGEGWGWYGHGGENSSRASFSPRALSASCLTWLHPGPEAGSVLPKTIHKRASGTEAFGELAPCGRQASLPDWQARTPHLHCAYVEQCLKPISLTCHIFSCSSLCNFKYTSLEQWLSEMYCSWIVSTVPSVIVLHISMHRISPLIASG